jgi:hypothetical protein
VFRVYVFLEAENCELYAQTGWSWEATLASLRRLLL